MNPILYVDDPVDPVIEALTSVGSILTQATTMISGNAIAMVFIGFALVAGGVGLFRRIVKRR